MHPRTLVTTVVSLGCSTLLGCDPDALFVGGGLPEEQRSEVVWQSTTVVGASIVAVAAMPDDGVTIIEQRGLGGRHLRRFASDGTELFTVPLSGWAEQLAVWGDSLFVGGSSQEHLDGPDRATVWRFSADGRFEEVYQHPRGARDNAFTMRMAITEGELGLLVGNWGQLQPDEGHYELVRLSHAFEVTTPRVAFEGEDLDLGVDQVGDFVALERFDDRPDRIHRFGAEPRSVDIECDLLLADGQHPPLCAATQGTARLVDLDSGEAVDVEGFPVRVTHGLRSDTALLYGSHDDGTVLRLADILADGTAIPHLDIEVRDGEHLVPGSAARATDGAVYLALTEVLGSGPCEPEGVEYPCVQGRLFRIER